MPLPHRLLALTLLVASGCTRPVATDSPSPTLAVTTVVPSTAVPTTVVGTLVPAAPATTVDESSDSSPPVAAPAQPTTTLGCPPLTVVVLGNSTDFWPELVIGQDHPSPDAWPALLGLALDDLPVPSVTVRNEAVLGAGIELGYLGAESERDRLRAIIAAGTPDPDVLVVAPSVIDLQLNGRDVDASFAALEALVVDAGGAFDFVVVLPMNPVTEQQGTALAEAIAAFNLRLRGSPFSPPDWVPSPLLDGDGPFGRAEFYDDFEDERVGDDDPDPDGLHPDADGHRALADAAYERVAALVVASCWT